MILIILKNVTITNIFLYIYKYFFFFKKNILIIITKVESYDVNQNFKIGA